MRVSDTERQRTVDELRRHCAAGRLAVDEYATRIEKAMSSSTFEELDCLLADLPMMRIAEPAGLRSGRIWALPGGGRDGDDTSGSTDAVLRRRLSASLVVVLSVVVVVTTVILALAVSFGWAAVLLAGWLAGLIQGRLLPAGRSKLGG